MQMLIIAVGKELPKELGLIANDYITRLKPFTSLEWKLFPASPSKNADECRNQESKAILDSLKSNDSVVLLDERGQQMTNDELAQKLEFLAGAQGRLVFVIGGAFGVNDEVRSRASFVWSFSKLVFPHMLMRVMLLEQIYRTFMVQKGHPYHHN